PASARRKKDRRIPPVPKVWAPGDPDVVPEPGHRRCRTVQQRPSVPEAFGEQRGVLVLRWVEHTSSFERHEVVRGREADERGAWVQNRVDRLREALRGDDRIAGEAFEDLAHVAVVNHANASSTVRSSRTRASLCIT